MSRHRKVKALDYDEEYDDYYGAFDDEDDEDFDVDEEDFEAKYLKTGIDLKASESNDTSSKIKKQQQEHQQQQPSCISLEEKQSLSILNNPTNDENAEPHVIEKIQHTTSTSLSVGTSHELLLSSATITNRSTKSITGPLATSAGGRNINDDVRLVANITSDLTRIAIQHLDKHQWQLPLMEMDQKFRDKTYYKHYSDTYITSLRSKLGHFLADNELISNPMRYHVQQEMDNYRKYSKMFALLTDYYQSLGSGFFSFATPSPDEDIVIGCRMGTKAKTQPPKQNSTAKDDQSTTRFEYHGKSASSTTTTTATTSSKQPSTSKQSNKTANVQKKGSSSETLANKQKQPQQPSKPRNDLTIQENFTAEQLSKLAQEQQQKQQQALNLSQEKNRKLQSFSTKSTTTNKPQTVRASNHQADQPTQSNKNKQQTGATTSKAHQQLKPLATLVEKRQQLKQQLKRANELSEKDREAFRLRALQTTKEYQEFIGSIRPRLNLIVVGHVDAGKSTLVGHLLYKLGEVSGKQMHRNEVDSQRSGKASFKFAWALDETQEERERGVTIDLALTKFETPKKDIILLDAPGHVDFIPAVISGAAQADAALLVVDATRGEFETGFSAGGQTREHTFLARSLGVKALIVVVNKMDNVDWQWSRFSDIVEQLRPFLKQVGFNLKDDVQFVAASGLTGENLVERRLNKKKKLSSHPQLESQNDLESEMSSLLEAIDSMPQPERMVDKPTRVWLTDVYKGMSSGVFLGGKVVSGKIELKQKLVLLPPNEQCEIKQVESRDGKSNRAFAGDIITTVAQGVDMNKYFRGCLLCDPIMPCHVTNRFQARIVMFQNIGLILIKGTPIEVHINGTNESGVVRKLISLLNKSSGELIQRKPRCLVQNSSAIIQLRLDRVVCCELYEDNKDLGRFMMRSYGKTIAAGLITKIKPAKVHRSGGAKMKSK